MYTVSSSTILFSSFDAKLTNAGLALDILCAAHLHMRLHRLGFLLPQGVVRVTSSHAMVNSLTLHFRSRYSSVLLARRAKKMRAETGDLSIMTEQELHRRPLSDILVEALVRPLSPSTLTLK